MGRAIADFELIADGDRILVAMSGGKDSYALLSLLLNLRDRAPVRFSLVAVNLDQGHPAFPAGILREHLERTGVEFRMVKEDTYSIVQRLTPAGKSFCPVCSRLRRGILYNVAVELSCTKIALGHHRDDLIETLLLSALFEGALKTMPPKLFADDGRNTVIRPLAYCAEETLAAYAAEKGFPILPCDLCGSQENLQRKRVKKLLTELAAEHPQVKGNLLAALGNVVPSRLLDRSLLSSAKGKDPWISEGDDDGGCAVAARTEALLLALKAPASPAPDAKD
jgi:tRNA 2-thiocytidine biosynthesis protein TtcA